MPKLLLCKHSKRLISDEQDVIMDLDCSIGWMSAEKQLEEMKQATKLGHVQRVAIALFQVWGILNIQILDQVLSW